MITVKVDISKAMRKIDLAKEQLPFAAASALTKTIQQARTDAKAGFSVFSSVTSATLRSLYIVTASKSNLVATIGIKDYATGWMGPEIKGGPRYSGIETWLKPANLPPPGMYAVPGSAAPMNGAGHLNLNAIKRIVSQLVAQPQSTGQIIKRRRGGRKAEYFSLSKPLGGLKPGIYSKRGVEIQPILMFVGQPQYHSKYDFYGITTASIQRNWPTQFALAAANAMRTAR
jgi:hypothetical protein